MIFFLSLNYLFIYIVFFENLKDFLTQEILFLFGVSYCLTAIIQVCLYIFYNINKRDTELLNKEDDEFDINETEDEKIAQEFLETLDAESLKELFLIIEKYFDSILEEQTKKLFDRPLFKYFPFSPVFESNYNIFDFLIIEKFILSNMNFEYYWGHSNSIDNLTDVELKKISRFIKIRSVFRIISFLNYDFNLCIYLSNFLKIKETKMIKYMSKIENYDAAIIDYLLKSEERVLIYFKDIFLILVIFGDDFKVKKIIFSDKFV